MTKLLTPVLTTLNQPLRTLFLQGLRPYIKDAQRLIIQARTTHSQRILQVIEGRVCY